MTLYLAAVIWAAGFSQVQVAAGLYAPLLRERYHAMPASQMVVKGKPSPTKLLADDQLNALIYYVAACGGLCGEGGYVWLRRDTVSSPWRVAKKIVRSIS